MGGGGGGGGGGEKGGLKRRRGGLMRKKGRIDIVYEILLIKSISTYIDAKKT